jgi:hypothetical protein
MKTLPVPVRGGRSLFFLSIAALVVALLIVSTVAAQSGGGYDLSWNTIAAGGGSSTSGDYSLAGTIGQSDTGMLSGGGYMLNGGFWSGFSGNYRCICRLCSEMVNK